MPRAPADAAPQGAAAGLRVLIVAASRAQMTLLRHLLACEWPRVEVTEYDAEQCGEPPSGFDWSLYDVMLLDSRLGAGTSGLDWLGRYRHCAGFPPTLLMTDDLDENARVRAVEAGAHDIVEKIAVDRPRLAALVRAALRARHPTWEITRPDSRPRNDDHVVREIRLPRDALTSTVGRSGYRFVRLIGQGATSRIYLAERTGDRQTLVLKIVDAASLKETQVLRRFTREAELIAAIDSPFVVKFLEHGFTESYGFIAMEFFTRGDLKQRIEHGVSVDDAVNYLLHIAYGLRAIHGAGIVHRDLKPGNIMFRSDDSLALADFGISKRVDEASDITRAGAVLGTPNYISPEQALGQKVDPRADLYSAGAIFYEMLAGRKPYRAESAAALVYQHVYAEIPRLPPAVRRFQPIVDALLAKEPAQRFTCADDVIAALHSLWRPHSAPT